MERFSNPIIMFNDISGDLVLVANYDDKFDKCLLKGYKPIAPTKEHMEDLIYRTVVSEPNKEDLEVIVLTLQEVFRDDSEFKSKYIAMLKEYDIAPTLPIEYFVKRNKDFGELVTDLFSVVGTHSEYEKFCKYIVEHLKFNEPAKPKFVYGNFELVQNLGSFKNILDNTALITYTENSVEQDIRAYFKELETMARLAVEGTLNDNLQDVFDKMLNYLRKVLEND